MGGVSRGVVYGTETDIDYHLRNEESYCYCAKYMGWCDVAKALVRETQEVLGFSYCRFVFNPRWLDFVYDNVVDTDLSRPAVPDYWLFRILPEFHGNNGDENRRATEVAITEVDLCIGRSDLFAQSGITYTKWFEDPPPEFKKSASETIADLKKKLSCDHFYKSKDSPVKYGISVDSLVCQAGEEGTDYVLPGKGSPEFVRCSPPSTKLLCEGLEKEITKWAPSESKALGTWHICYLMKPKPIFVGMFPCTTKQQIEQRIKLLGPSSAYRKLDM